MLTTCNAPALPSCCTFGCPAVQGPVPLTLEERIRRNPAIFDELGLVARVMNVPLGSLLLVDYEAHEHPSPEAMREALAMPRNYYLGRITSREDRGGYVLFRMIVLNRGDAGFGAMRTFSTRVGSLHGARLFELPRI